MHRILLLLLLLLPTAAHAGHKCFIGACKQSYCNACYPKQVVSKKSAASIQTTTIESEVKIENNLIMPKFVPPMKFASPELLPAQQLPTQRRHFQFSVNFGDIPSRPAPQKAPQQQQQQRSLVEHQQSVQPFIIQNVITSSSATSTETKSQTKSKTYTEQEYKKKEYKQDTYKQKEYEKEKKQYEDHEELPTPQPKQEQTEELPPPPPSY